MAETSNDGQGQLFQFPIERTMRHRVPHPDFVLEVTDALHDAGHVDKALGILSVSEALQQALNEGNEVLHGDSPA